jgi:hypothetical protein
MLRIRSAKLRSRESSGIMLALFTFSGYDKRLIEAKLPNFRPNKAYRPYCLNTE